MTRKGYHFKKHYVCSASVVMLMIFFHPSTGQPITILPELPASEGVKQFTITENDSTIYDVNLAVANNGLPLYYFRNVFTPVCYTEVCKPVYINLYWDLLGNYLGFQVPAHEPLTKTDHKKFEEKDYGQLHKILSNTQSILQDFTIYELVDTRTYNLSDSVDAVTGATPKTIKNEVIGGAVYTCFTLWHIVNGPVSQALREITERHQSKDLLKEFLRSDNHHYQYWAIDKTVNRKETTLEFLPDILEIITGKNIFTARYALEKLPSEVLSASDSLQSWLRSVYKESNYTLQLSILEKFQDLELNDALTLSLCNELKSTNEEQFNRILRLLEKTEKLPGQTVSQLVDYLETLESHRAAKVYNILAKLSISSGEVRKKMKRFEKSNPHLH